MKTEKNLQVLGVAWYRRDQWSRLLEVSRDRHDLEDTYDEWVAVAQKRFDDLARAGIRVHRVEIDIEELVEWCRETNRPVDGSARAIFTANKTKDKYGKTV